MNVVIHQPHFLPWSGYFNKLANADIFIVQDNVQFRRRYYQNRTKIRSNHADYLWLTIPIRARRNSCINEVVLAKEWKEKALKRIYHTYRQAPFFSNYYEGIQNCILNSNEQLSEINISLIKHICNILDIEIRVMLTSEFLDTPPPPNGLANITQSLGGKKYIFGEGGGMMYHGTAVFHKRKIQTVRQDFRNTYCSYIKDNRKGSCNLTVLDDLFHLGEKEVEKIVKTFWVIG